MKVTVSVKGDKEVIEKLQQVNKDLNGPGLIGGMSKAVTIVESSAKRYAPVDRGQLKSSITSDIFTDSNNNIVGVVGTNVKHAPYQELGTRPFWPPLQPLIDWVKRKFHATGNAAYMIAKGVQRSISRRGIKPKGYLQKAYTENLSRIQSILEKAVDETVEK